MNSSSNLPEQRSTDPILTNAIELLDAETKNILDDVKYAHLKTRLESMNFKELTECFEQLLSAEDIAQCKKTIVKIALTTRSRFIQILGSHRNITLKAEAVLNNSVVGMLCAFSGVGGVLALFGSLSIHSTSWALGSAGFTAMGFAPLFVALDIEKAASILRMEDTSDMESMPLFSSLFHYYQYRLEQHYVEKLMSELSTLENSYYQESIQSDNEFVVSILQELKNNTNIDQDYQQNNVQPFKTYIQRLASYKAGEELAPHKQKILQTTYGLLQTAVTEKLRPIEQQMKELQLPNSFLGGTIAQIESQLAVTGTIDEYKQQFRALESNSHPQLPSDAVGTKPKKKLQKKKYYRNSYQKTNL